MGARSVDWCRGSPPPSHQGGMEVWAVVYVFGTGCVHSANNFPGFVSAASSFVGSGEGKTVWFGALTKEDRGAAEEFASRFTKHKSLAKVSVGSDLGSAVASLSLNFGVDAVPHVYVIKDGTVEWDGHPCNLEQTLALQVGFWG